MKYNELLSQTVKRIPLCSECDSETCLFNPEGICLYPLISGHEPEFIEEYGCLGWVDGEEEN